MHEYGFKTVAMALRNDSVRIDDEKLHEEEKLAIILGTEGDGLAAETMADCDYTVKIPMSHGVDSLNERRRVRLLSGNLESNGFTKEMGWSLENEIYTAI